MSEWYELIKDDYYIDFKKNKLVITVATNYNGAIYAELDLDIENKSHLQSIGSDLLLMLCPLKVGQEITVEYIKTISYSNLYGHEGTYTKVFKIKKAIIKSISINTNTINYEIKAKLK